MLLRHQIQVTTDQQTCATVNRKHSSSSPTMSPAPKQLKKRQRTLREHSHTTIQVGGGGIPSDMFANMHEFTAYQRPSISQFTIRSFRSLPEEEQCLAQL